MAPKAINTSANVDFTCIPKNIITINPQYMAAITKRIIAPAKAPLFVGYAPF